MRKLLSISLATLALSLPLVGCGGTKSQPAPAPSGTPMEQAVAALHKLEALPAEKRAGAPAQETAALIKQAGTPLMDNGALLFVYQGQPGQTVTLEQWDDGPLTALQGTDLYVLKRPIARLDEAIYSYGLNVGGTHVADPWTHLPAGGFGHVYTGPKAPASPEKQKQDGRAAGKVETVSIDSKALGEQRSFTIYTPPGYDTAKTYPLLVVFDGTLFMGERYSMPTVLDNLLAAGQMPAVIAVGVHPDMSKRLEEYVPGKSRFAAHQKFVLDEVLPYVEQHFKVNTGKDQAVAMGFSAGGGSAYVLAATHPERFRGGVLLSPVAAQESGVRAKGQRFYITQGTMDPAAVTGNELNGNLAKENTTQYFEGVGSHDPAFGSVMMVQGLRWFYQK